MIRYGSVDEAAAPEGAERPTPLLPRPRTSADESPATGAAKPMATIKA